VCSMDAARLTTESTYLRLVMACGGLMERTAGVLVRAHMWNVALGCVDFREDMWDVFVFTPAVNEYPDIKARVIAKAKSLRSPSAPPAPLRECIVVQLSQCLRLHLLLLLLLLSSCS
jgi:hypothetical protein